MTEAQTRKAVSFQINSYCEHNQHLHIKNGKFMMDDMVYYCQIKFLESFENVHERQDSEVKAKNLKFIEETVKDWYARHQTLSQTFYKPVTPKIQI